MCVFDERYTRLAFIKNTSVFQRVCSSKTHPKLLTFSVPVGWLGLPWLGLVGWLVGWMVGWLVDLLVGWVCIGFAVLGSD